MLKFYNKVNKKMGKAGYIALLTRTKIKKHYEWQMKYGLRHEWIHILLGKNKIKFQEIDKKLWPYDEGVNEFMGCFIDENLGNLEEFRNKENYPIEHLNWVYAIRFRELFKDKTTPKQKKKVIFKLMKRLRKRRLR